MNLNINTLALATFQVRECTDDHVVDTRVIAIGLMHTSMTPDGDLNFLVDAIACDPATPSTECAGQLADWLLAQTDAPTQVIAWGVRDPLIAGLSDIAGKVDGRVARNLSTRFQTWSVLNAFDISSLFFGSGIQSLEDAANQLIIDHLPLRSPSLEPACTAQREQLRDMVATAAVATWRIWSEARGGLAPQAHGAAVQALAEWRKGNRAK